MCVVLLILLAYYYYCVYITAAPLVLPRQEAGLVAGRDLGSFVNKNKKRTSL